MSLDFKLHYDRLREGDPTKPEAAATTNEEGSFYDAPNHARNLCLIWPDGKRKFLNYAYLVGGEFTADGERNVITLNFSAYLVTLKGYSLEALFDAILDQLPRRIVQVDARYMHRENEREIVIIDIAVQTARV